MGIRIRIRIRIRDRDKDPNKDQDADQRRTGMTKVEEPLKYTYHNITTACVENT